MTQFVIDQGDDEVLDLTLKKPDGTALDLTGCKLWFAINKSSALVEALIEKTSDPGEGITITAPPTSGLAVVEIARADTASLPAAYLGRPLPWAVQVLDGADKVSTLAKGTIVIAPDLITTTA